MKNRFMVAAMLGSAMVASSASAIQFGFDPDGAGVFVPTITNVVEFDWGVGNVLADNALVSPGGVVDPVGSTFFTYYQARLQGFEVGVGSNANPGGGSSGGTLLPFGHEITIVAGFLETVTAVGGGGTTASFSVTPDAANFVRIYYDTTGADGIFNDGILVLDGTPVSGDSSLDVLDPNVNKGALNIVAKINSVDTNFFVDLPDLLLLSLSNPGTVQDLGGVPNLTTFTDINGNTVTYDASTEDFAFRSDVNTRLEVIPEPVTAAMGLISLGALGFAALRRRQA